MLIFNFKLTLEGSNHTRQFTITVLATDEAEANRRAWQEVEKKATEEHEIQTLDLLNSRPVKLPYVLAFVEDR